MARRAAVVIGVNKTGGGLAPLSSAAVGAERVAAWLRAEGYVVECLTDASGPVASRQVEDAIGKFVTLPPSYDLLIVYFSGHGSWHARADHWLLSGAPTRTSEAINLEGTMDLARSSGIPNVIFVSDACRSIPDARAGARVDGIDAFPNYDEVTTTSKIDQFRATSEALAAYEVAGESVLTRALISAYQNPAPGMVREVNDGSRTVRVVPNRKLEDYLQQKVDELLAAIDTNLSQPIVAVVPSADDVYISRVIEGPPEAGRRGPSLPGPTPSMRPISLGRRAARTIAADLSGGDTALDTSEPAMEAAIVRRLPGPEVDHFESGVGFLVRGARVARLLATRGGGSGRAELLTAGSAEEPAIVRLWDIGRAVSVAIQVEDGRCAIVPALEGYIGHVVFDARGVSTVSYVPSSNHWRWSAYAYHKVRIDRLRSLVSLAVDRNTFRVTSSEEARSLADQIRIDKGVDPSLGLYAAHAYYQAGKPNEVASVLDYMRGDLGVDLFDVLLLASKRGVRDSALPVVPFCPLLTQTWSLLRPRRIAVPDPLEAARKFLCDSLWTTFEGEAADSIFDAIEAGMLR